MYILRLSVLLGFTAVAATARAPLPESEQNAWPVNVQYREAENNARTWTGAGPFLFRTPATEPSGFTASGFRPFWVQTSNPNGELRSGYFLYPLFSYRRDETAYSWSVFELIRRRGRPEGARPPESVFSQRASMEIIPFWFSYESGDPRESYRGLFPLHGTVRNRLGFERVSWTLFPFYVEKEDRGAVTTSTPWPFIRVTRGTATGWGFWPFYQRVERPGVSRQTTYLWPFGYDHTREPAADAPAGTPARRNLGALPFYARTTGPGYVSESFVWPFFGYTDQAQPKQYRESRYFWPFLVQGRGEDHYTNRWAPFYTHSIHKGYDKQWVAWPLVRYAEWKEGGIERKRTQLLFFLFWNEEQRTSHEPGSRTASLTHLWPFLSHWDNGAGHLQWQALSPLDVFFPRNEKVRLAWSPLFALARYEKQATGNERTSLLWNAITWTRHRAAEHSEFHLGPILGVTRRADERRIAIGNGLFGLRRTGATGWRLFWLDFSRTPDTSVSGSR